MSGCPAAAAAAAAATTAAAKVAAEQDLIVPTCDNFMAWHLRLSMLRRRQEWFSQVKQL